MAKKTKKQAPGKAELKKQGAELKRLDKLILRYLRQKKDLSLAEELDLKKMVELKRGIRKADKAGKVYIPEKKATVVRKRVRRDISGAPESNEYFPINILQFWEVSGEIEKLKKDSEIIFDFESIREIIEFSGQKLSKYSGKTKVKSFYITLFSVVARIGRLVNGEHSNSDQIRFLFNLFQSMDFSTGIIKYKLTTTYLFNL